MLRDLRFAVLLLVKERWYSLVAIAVLSLGIGLNATVFTLVDAVLIRGLPFKDSAQLFMVGSHQRSGEGFGGVSYPDLLDWRTQSRSFAGFGAFEPSSVSVSDDRSAPQQVRAVYVTANTFSLLGQPMLLGRDFGPDDERPGAASAVIVGYTMWKTRYAEDRGIVGHTVRINGEAATIVGVMPEGVMFPAQAELWKAFVPAAGDLKRDARDMQVFGRVRAGVSRPQALTEMTGIAERLAAAYPSTNKEFRRVTVQTFNEAFNGGQVRVVFLSMMGAVGFVLLIACANVANLLLSRSAQRVREIAVRIAIGATRWAIVRQLLVESVLLGCLGGLVGLGFAAIGVRLFDAAVRDVGKPYWIVFRMDYLVFGFLAAICLLTGILFGLAPALQVSRTNVNDVLKEGGRGNAGGTRARWLTGTMVIAELALTLVLLVGAGLMVRSFLKLYTLDLGFRTDRLMTMRMQLPSTKYASLGANAVPGTRDPRVIFFDRLLPKVASIPGVESAAVATSVPPMGSGRRAVEMEGHPLNPGERAPIVSVVTITPTFFETVGVSFRRGRPFTDVDGSAGNETVIVSDAFVARYFHGADPVGTRLRFSPQTAPQAAQQAVTTPPVWRTIVGVAPMVRYAEPQESDPPAVVYTPMRQDPSRGVVLVVRAHADPTAIMAAVRADVQTIDADQPVFTIQTMDQLLTQLMWPYRVFGSLFAIFAIIGLAMSAVGLYAVMAYSVTQRTAEIGVRMALGADAWEVSWLILKRGLIQMALGLAIGLAGALGVSRIMQTLLVQITPTDPVTFASISILLGVISMAACVIPARRATRVDPLVALRAE